MLSKFYASRKIFSDSVACVLTLCFDKKSDISTGYNKRRIVMIFYQVLFMWVIYFVTC